MKGNEEIERGGEKGGGQVNPPWSIVTKGLVAWEDLCYNCDVVSFIFLKWNNVAEHLAAN